MPVHEKAVLEGTHPEQSTYIESPDYDLPSTFYERITKLSIDDSTKTNLEKSSPFEVDMSSLSKAVSELHDAISDNPNLKEDHMELCKLFYRMQPIHKLGESAEILRIPIYIDEDVTNDWPVHFKRAIIEINEAAPGLALFEVDTIPDRGITVQRSGNENCYTIGSIHTVGLVFVRVADEWPTKKSTSTHELLHALGFQHEMKRLYASLHVVVETGKIPGDWRMQYEESDAYHGLTRFDPLSIMMYTLDERMNRRDWDLVWKHKPSNERSEEMSELDKVALNLVFKPCRRKKYNPQISTENGILYCGRHVTATHNSPAPAMTDGRCGPNNGPNCPACRVLVEPFSSKRERLHQGGKWQGWSGLFYCGRTAFAERSVILVDPKLSYTYYVHNDGVCGPNNGNPCDTCGKELYAPYNCEEEYGPYVIKEPGGTCVKQKPSSCVLL